MFSVADVLNYLFIVVKWYDYFLFVPKRSSGQGLDTSSWAPPISSCQVVKVTRWDENNPLGFSLGTLSRQDLHSSSSTPKSIGQLAFLPLSMDLALWESKAMKPPSDSDLLVTIRPAPIAANINSAAIATEFYVWPNAFPSLSISWHFGGDLARGTAVQKGVGIGGPPLRGYMQPVSISGHWCLACCQLGIVKDDIGVKEAYFDLDSLLFPLSVPLEGTGQIQLPSKCTEDVNSQENFRLLYPFALHRWIRPSYPLSIARSPLSLQSGQRRPCSHCRLNYGRTPSCSPSSLLDRNATLHAISEVTHVDDTQTTIVVTPCLPAKGAVSVKQCARSSKGVQSASQHITIQPSPPNSTLSGSVFDDDRVVDVVDVIPSAEVRLYMLVNGTSSSLDAQFLPIFQILPPSDSIKVKLPSFFKLETYSKPCNLRAETRVPSTAIPSTSSARLIHPCYIIAHKPHQLGEVKRALEGGAMLLAASVNVLESETHL
ncbi:hypothetical protein BDN72DRAFT_862221 [Pluteus cervinus]|uniref:Uncharacterized protein n=1 Tax=Pluteus cervinus TaxID=181527 RepID=A0ACD3AEN6_9AGAR|nr:hypothetical protein BDN72DRAFT_862221 [Pluteus cervinus]